jgi:hypothetical protein
MPEVLSGNEVVRMGSRRPISASEGKPNENRFETHGREADSSLQGD